MDNEYNLTDEQITELAKLSLTELCAVINIKYFDLVSYACKPPEWRVNNALCRRAEKLYPMEVDSLLSSEWRRGFNSGVLATMRLFWEWDEQMVSLGDNNDEVISSIQESRETHIWEFPFLDL